MERCSDENNSFGTISGGTYSAVVESTHFSLLQNVSLFKGFKIAQTVILTSSTLRKTHDNSRGALTTSLYVALNCVLSYGLFMAIRIIHTLSLYTDSMTIHTQIAFIHANYNYIGLFYISLLPTLSSMLNPIIYFAKKDDLRSWIRERYKSLAKIIEKWRRRR